MSNSADGSVNGKYDGRRRDVKSPPKNALVNASIVPARSAEGDAPVDDQALDLVEHRHVAWRRRCRWRNTRPGHDDVDRRLPGVCITRICTGEVCVRSTIDLGLAEVDEEGVVHAAGRVARRHVERLEVVPVGLDLGALGDCEAEADEHVLEPLAGLGDEVEVARVAARPTTSVRSSRSAASCASRAAGSSSVAAAPIASASTAARSPR